MSLTLLFFALLVVAAAWLPQLSAAFAPIRFVTKPGLVRSLSRWTNGKADRQGVSLCKLAQLRPQHLAQWQLTKSLLMPPKFGRNPWAWSGSFLLAKCLRGQALVLAFDRGLESLSAPARASILGSLPSFDGPACLWHTTGVGCQRASCQKTWKQFVVAFGW